MPFVLVLPSNSPFVLPCVSPCTLPCIKLAFACVVNLGRAWRTFPLRHVVLFVHTRGSYILEDADTLVSLPQIQPLSPGAGAPFTPRAMSLSCSVSGITTASSTASLIKVAQDPFGSSGGDVSPITPAQIEAASCYQRLKAENDVLVEK